MLRKFWTTDHITESFPVHESTLVSMRTLPQPARHVPLWVGGHADVALRRAIVVGDGWHGAFLSPEQTEKRVRTLRAGRPEETFAISMRTRWDALLDEEDLIMYEIDRYREVGVTHLVPEPRQRTVDLYMESMEKMASILVRAGVEMKN
jgi:hypothetical protein